MVAQSLKRIGVRSVRAMSIAIPWIRELRSVSAHPPMFIYYEPVRGIFWVFRVLVWGLVYVMRCGFLYVAMVGILTLFGYCCDLVTYQAH